ncbi:hypothetical protein Y032_0294g1644 [Ancylostoma ceylanicum]|uniref:Uncharacterized protein n=1 Tax=Ancylostoma ceylanicum TaxID=53326 RepID=A0A016S4S6_9BILA|nr:hypothetical protein Y032_0294g1644 [Ancylostoma ceylanicum]
MLAFKEGVWMIKDRASRSADAAQTHAFIVSQLPHVLLIKDALKCLVIPMSLVLGIMVVCWEGGELPLIRSGRVS